MIKRIAPKFGTNGLKTYASAANMQRAVEQVLQEGDRYVPCHDPLSARWAPVIISRGSWAGAYAHHGFTVTN